MTDPATVGDPDAMRALARQLMTRADVLSAAQRGPAAQLAAATFDGPAASRLRGTAEELRTRLGGVCADLQATAQSLLTDASAVEQQNVGLRIAATQAAEQEAAAKRAAAAPPPDPVETGPVLGPGDVASTDGTPSS